MSAVGPNTPPLPPEVYPTSWNVAVTLSTADVLGTALFTYGQITKITVCSAGTLYLQGVNDAAMVPFIVIVGQVLIGLFQAIGGSTTGSTSGLKLVASIS